jgi:hypothetical protein
MAKGRSATQRKADVLALLERNADAWLATAGEGVPHVIATATAWDGESIVIATRGPSISARNLDGSGVARLALGTADDAVLIDVTVVRSVVAAEDAALDAKFGQATGWSAAEQGPEWRYFVLRPMRIQAFRGYAETQGREVMRVGRWLA